MHHKKNHYKDRHTWALQCIVEKLSFNVLNSRDQSTAIMSTTSGIERFKNQYLLHTNNITIDRLGSSTQDKIQEKYVFQKYTWGAWQQEYRILAERRKTLVSEVNKFVRCIWIINVATTPMLLSSWNFAKTKTLRLSKKIWFKSFFN